MSGDELLTGTFLCFLDYLKVILVFDEILKYKKEKDGGEDLAAAGSDPGSVFSDFFSENGCALFSDHLSASSFPCTGSLPF